MTLIIVADHVVVSVELHQEVQEVFFKGINVDEKATVVEVSPWYLTLKVGCPSEVPVVPLSHVSLEPPRVLQKQKTCSVLASFIIKRVSPQQRVSMRLTEP